MQPKFLTQHYLHHLDLQHLTVKFLSFIKQQQTLISNISQVQLVECLRHCQPQCHQQQVPLSLMHPPIVQPPPRAHHYLPHRNLQAPPVILFSGLERSLINVLLCRSICLLSHGFASHRLARYAGRITCLLPLVQNPSM